MDRKFIINIAKLIIGIGVIYFLINYVEPQNILNTFQSSNKIYLFLALLLLPLNLYLQYYKWNKLSRKYFSINDKKKVWLSLLYGISGGIFTPMKSGEYFARSIPYENTKVVDVILVTLIDKLIPTIIISIIGGILSIFFLQYQLSYSLLTALILVLIYIVLCFSILYLIFGNHKISLSIRQFLKEHKYSSKIVKRVSFIKSIDRKTLKSVIVSSVLFHIVFTVQMAILLNAFSPSSNFILFLYLANLIIFVQIIIPPIAFGEIGIREGAAVYFLESMGFAGVIGFNAAITLFSINLLIPSIIGALLLFLNRRGRIY